MSKEINLEDLIKMAGDNVYDTEYSMKLSIPCRTSTHILFKDLKDRLHKQLGVKVNNAKLFEIMVVELYNSH
jgi:hypothetical protein|tara:strand:+ start:183 stop:398 length:216 start_codon:yes stop_codon:yes gene_type:complete